MYDYISGTLNFEQIWGTASPIILTGPGSEDTFIIPSVQKLVKVTKIFLTVQNIMVTRSLKVEIRYTQDSGVSYTDWYELEIRDLVGQVLELDPPPSVPLDKFLNTDIEFRFTRTGNDDTGNMSITELNIEGIIHRNEIPSSFLIAPGSTVVFRVTDVYKVFKLRDVEVITDANPGELGIRWRFSQDNTRTWSIWENMTKENVMTRKISPIRFFHVEYELTNNSGQTIEVTDINLIGEFQNVTKDSVKTNLYGVRECCLSQLLNGNGTGGVVGQDGVFYANPSGFLDGGGTCVGKEGGIYSPMTDEDRAKLYNPYAQGAALDLLNKMSNDTVEIFGHSVHYLVTDPDEKGIDYSLHEFGTFNIVCEGKLKVSVDQNQFPDNQITMNQFDLSLFDTFEVHITKDHFKNLFGVQRRPSKEDIIHFCDINRLFIVDHAQAFRNFNNYSIFYKVVLKKYNDRANVRADGKSIQDRIKSLTAGTTLDELMGLDKQEDKKAVANKDVTQPLTRDPIRLDSVLPLNDIIVKMLLENSDTVISKQHYDLSLAFLSGVAPGQPIIRYKNLMDTGLGTVKVSESDNISFTCWFSINNLLVGENFNFFTQGNDVLGWSIDMSDNVFRVTRNGQVTEWTLDDPLEEDVWYSYVLNLEQRTGGISQWIYRRGGEEIDEENVSFLPSTKLYEVDSFSLDGVEPFGFESEDVTNFSGSITLSDMKLTNIRLYVSDRNDGPLVPKETHDRFLNRYIPAEENKYLVFADNANMRLRLPNESFSGSVYDRP